MKESKLARLLLDWYDENARRLPWRGTGDPYRIWLSEIMLQQTRTEAVKKYYARFLDAFPDVFALANAQQDQVLKLWEGLGYYSRARNLHAAAKLIANRGGAFPDTIEGLEELPGIGPYAARAIGSIAYNICAPALDGNQMRVLSRCFAVDRILKTPFDLESEAMACISRDRPGDYNQALMDLGSGICTPKNPKCEICPLASICKAMEEGEPERYPLRPAPVAKREEEHSIFLIECRRKICIRRRDEKKLLGGLYEFPSAEGHMDAAAVAERLQELGFGGTGEIRILPTAKHVFTHLIWRMQGWHIMVEEIPAGMQAVDADGIRALAFPSALRKYREIALEILEESGSERTSS